MDVQDRLQAQVLSRHAHRRLQQPHPDIRLVTFTALLGLLRSLLTYYALPWRRVALKRFYRDLLPQDTLMFDVGAHVGSRSRSVLSIGGRAIAIEPQPVFARWLGWLFRDNPRVELVVAAVGAQEGQASLQISSRHPTVSTLSRDWIGQVEQSAGFEHVAWDKSIDVPVTTVDRLSLWSLGGFVRPSARNRFLSQPRFGFTAWWLAPVLVWLALVLPAHPDKFNLQSLLALPLELPLVILAVLLLPAVLNRAFRAVLVVFLLALVLLRLADVGSKTRQSLSEHSQRIRCWTSIRLRSQLSLNAICWCCLSSPMDEVSSIWNRCAQRPCRGLH